MPSSAAVSGLVLAAGFARRLGETKALVEVGGRPALRWALDTFAAVGGEGGVIVAGEARAEIAAATPAGWSVVENPDPDAGRTGSLQCGLRALPGGPVLLWPVDRPFAAAATVRAVLAAPAVAEWVVPYADGRGHPVRFGAKAVAAIRAAAPDANLRAVLTDAVGDPLEVPVDDPRVHWNLDTPDDVARVRTALG